MFSHEIIGFDLFLFNLKDKSKQRSFQTDKALDLKKTEKLKIVRFVFK